MDLDLCLSFFPVPKKPVSPYGAYNGQLRSCVYQPTELALIAKGMTKVSVYTISDTKKPSLLSHLNQSSDCFYRWIKMR